MISERCSGPVRTGLRAGPFLWAGSGQPRPGSQQGKCCRNGNARIMDAMTDGEMAPGKREAPSGSGSDKDACRDSIDARTLAEMDRAIANMEAGAVGKGSTCLISWMREAWRHLLSPRIQNVACGRLDGPEELHAEALLWRTCGLLCWKAPVCAACMDGRSSSGREAQRPRLPKDRFFESECLFYLYMRR